MSIPGPRIPNAPTAPYLGRSVPAKSTCRAEPAAHGYQVPTARSNDVLVTRIGPRTRPSSTLRKYPGPPDPYGMADVYDQSENAPWISASESIGTAGAAADGPAVIAETTMQPKLWPMR